MEARLAKVRQRKQLKQLEAVDEEEGATDNVVEHEGEGEGGEGGTEKEEGGGDVDSISAMIDTELGKAREKAEKGSSEEGGKAPKQKTPYVRPWDKGKG